MPQVSATRFGELDAATLYGLLRLRVDVFVVEQACPYPELDGRDTEPGTVHLWVERDGRVVACLRLLDDPAGQRIGRVCVAADSRGAGLAEVLVRAALQRCAGPVVLDAQTYLARWYERLGFAVAGPEFVEDGISHVPMRLADPLGRASAGRRR